MTTTSAATGADDAVVNASSSSLHSPTVEGGHNNTNNVDNTTKVDDHLGGDGSNTTALAPDEVDEGTGLLNGTLPGEQDEVLPGEGSGSATAEEGDGTANLTDHQGFSGGNNVTVGDGSVGDGVGGEVHSSLIIEKLTNFKCTWCSLTGMTA